MVVGRRNDFECDEWIEIKSDYTDVEDEYESALASGPMLLMEGKVCSFPQDAIYTQRMARSVIGISMLGK